MPSTELNLLDAAFFNIERAEDPWSIHLELELEGRIDECRLRDAIEHALELHPMARARLQPFTARAQRYFWDIGAEADSLPLEVVDFEDGGSLDEHRSRLLSRSIPLDTSPALRLLLARHGDGDRLIVNLNHMLADGLSAMRIITSIRRHYAGEADPVPDVDPLAVRDLTTLCGTRSLRERIERLRLFGEYLVDTTLPPVRVAPRHAAGTGGQGIGYGTFTLCLTEKQSARVAARRHKPATVNDLLIAALILSIRRWNESVGGNTGKVSVMMPVNLRPQDWWYEVVGNFSSYVNVILRSDQQTDLDAACSAVCEQTTRFKAAGAAGTLIDVLAVPKYLPAFLKATLREIAPSIGRSHVQTSWLSNLGRLPQAPAMGDAGRVKAIYFSPPAPMPMGLSVGAVTMADRMMLTLRYRHSLLDKEASRDFATMFLETLLD